MRTRLLAFLLVCSVLAASRALAQPSSPIEQARQYATQGSEALAAERWQEATGLFEQADRLYPTPNYKYYIGQALVKLGKLTAAARAYEAAAQPLPAGAAESWKTAQAEATRELATVRQRLGVVSVAVIGPNPGQARVTVDGVPVAERAWARIEVDPGAHAIAAEGRGFAPAQRKVSIGEGRTERVELVLSAEPPQPAPQEQEPPGAQETSPSHVGQWGLFARADVEALHGGARAALGASWGALPAVDLHAAALLGRDKGVEVALQLNLLRGALKPYVDLGVPLFFHDGASPGARAAAGIEWDPSRHVGLFVQVGGAYFPSVPPGYSAAALLPAAGIAGRL